MMDFGSDSFKEQAECVIQREIPKIENEKVRQLVKDNIEKIKAGERDLYL